MDHIDTPHPHSSRKPALRMHPAQQNSLVLVVNLLVTLVVFLLLWLGYHGEFHRVSALFWVLQIAVCLLALIASQIDSWVESIYSPSPPPHWSKWWAEHREEQQPATRLLGWVSYRGVMYVATIMIFASMWILTHDTGGGVESPFSPLLVAPAILGPFIVRQKEALVALLVAAVVSVVTADWYAPTRTIPPNHSLGSPGWGVYAFVTLVLVVSAIVISYVRHETDEPAWTLVKQWRTAFAAWRAMEGHERRERRDERRTTRRAAKVKRRRGAHDE